MSKLVLEAIRRGHRVNASAQKFIENLAKSTSNTSGETTSLVASVPILPPPASVSKALSESCNDAESEICYYGSRSSFGAEKLQNATMQYYKKSGFKVDGSRPIFTHSEHDLVLILAKKLARDNRSAIMTVPTFGLFFGALVREGVNVNLAKLSQDSDWKLTPEILRNALSAEENSNSGMFFFINPDNPTGKSYSKQEIEGIAQEFLGYNDWRKSKGKDLMMVFSDEASRRIMLNSNKDFFSLGAVQGMEEFTFTSSTSSKDLAPGIAISHAVGPKEIIEELLSPYDGKILPDMLTADRYGPSYPSQYLLTEIFNGTYQKDFDDHLEESVKIYIKNLESITNFVDEINSKLEKKFGESANKEKFLELVTKPDGGLQCLIQAKGLLGMNFPQNYQHKLNFSQRKIEGGIDLAEYLQETAGVKILTGEYCGFDKEEMMFRVTISKEPKILEKAFNQILNSLERLDSGLENCVSSGVVSNSQAVQVGSNQKGEASRS